MLPFIRPEVTIPVLRDASGSVIDYGCRWWPTGDEGPDDTYSVTLHPERFAPLLEVADALVDHLERAYVVVRTTEGSVTTLSPGDGAAPLRFEVTSFPLVRCTAGVATDLAWFCPCDHCDEDVLVVADALEEEVAIVVDGGLSEWLEDSDDGLYVHHSLTGSDARRHASGSSHVGDGRREAARAMYATVPDRWAPWTPRRAGR